MKSHLEYFHLCVKFSKTIKKIRYKLVYIYSAVRTLEVVGNYFFREINMYLVKVFKIVLVSCLFRFLSAENLELHLASFTFFRL